MPSNFKLDPGDYEIHPDELLVISIHSPGVPYYKLAYYLNQNMGWNLTNIQEAYRPLEDSTFSLNVLSHVDELSRVQYLLIENLSGYRPWIPKMADVSYWMVVTGAGLNESIFDVEQFEKRLSQTKYIFNASILPFDDILGNGKVSSIFRYFQFLYDFLDYGDFIHRFE